MMWRGAAFAFALLWEADAVDRSKFRTCQQGSFCRRFKAWTQRPNLDKTLWYILDGSRVADPDGGFTLKVAHREEDQAHLLLTVNPYKQGMVRLRLNEVDALHPRHIIPSGDAVDISATDTVDSSAVADGPGLTKVSFQSTNGDAIVADLHHSPLRMDVIVNGRLVQRVNARNFLNFERYRPGEGSRPRDGRAAEPAIALDAVANDFNNDTSGYWSESFGGHTDKKPRGPASFGLDVTFEGNVPSVFGLPEHATKASLPFYEEPYRFYNLDVFEYELDEPMALYGTIPMLWAIQRGESGQPNVVSGFLWINPSETFVKLERLTDPNPVHSWWVSESGVMDITVFAGSQPKSLSGQYHALTGHAPLPPMWALGKHQCRWNYQNEKDVATVDANYDAHDLPYDVIWLDIEHTDGKAYFSWHDSHFPTPHNMTDAISAKRRKMVLVVDPHMKKSDSFEIYKDIKEQGLFIKKVDTKQMDDPADLKPADWVETEKIRDPEAAQPEEWSTEDDGEWIAPEIDNPEYKGAWKARQVEDPNSPLTDFEGWCWPGTSLYPDFADPKMRDYWGSRFALDKYVGTNKDTYIWNDMNEPSVFNGPEVTMPRDAVHPHGRVEHRDLHNMYGYYVHRATFEGLQKRDPQDRPFVLTRSFFVGSHKYCAIWTGDNTAEWGHVGVSIGMVASLNLGGQSLVGADVGGFFKHPEGEMVTRWYQLAALSYGFFRNHAHLETPRREPYKYDAETLVRVKATLQQRYRMLPLWYTLFEEYHRLGHPVSRHLWWNHMDDLETHLDEDAVENEIMIGDVALVYGVSKPASEQTEANVYLPTGAGWYDMYTGEYSAPGKYTVPLTLDTIPAYYRAGTVVPLKSRVRRSSECMAADPLTLNIYLDPKTGTAEGRVYIDDYKTKAFEDGKSFLDVTFKYANGRLSPSNVRGGGVPDDVLAEVERLEIFGLPTEPSVAVLYQGTGAHHELAKPVSRALDINGFAATVKVVPFLNLNAGKDKWSIVMS